MDVLIRPAKKVDMPRMCLLLSELFSIEADFSPDLQKQSTGLSLLLNDKSDLSIVLVVEKDHEIIGMCSVQTLISTAEGGPVGLLEDLILRKEHRGNGIGTRLLSEIFRWCAAKDISRLQLLRDLDNERALKFYTGNGWAETRLVCMRKTLYFPLPTPPSATLAGRLPFRERYGFTKFRISNTDGLDPASSPIAVMSV